jgi:hypothetical protein
MDKVCFSESLVLLLLTRKGSYAIRRALLRLLRSHDPNCPNPRTREGTLIGHILFGLVLGIALSVLVLHVKDAKAYGQKETLGAAVVAISVLTLAYPPAHVYLGLVLLPSGDSSRETGPRRKTERLAYGSFVAAPRFFGLGACPYALRARPRMLGGDVSYHLRF